ncbi:MAG TPA: basic amino acid ABC transporter substrate-binding protein [Bacillota bacterium]|nr:MAG: ABC transporter arginine-binding protein 1 precursor [Firmicutes bacterium ADurb.Bin153]HNV33973.1 basic amino acid ABC transporter substrate-binding protein [Bacillota bacterium]HPU95273.1 basic amino acid ABC transporter substrate-binding protein [Bacillota bacterium]
MKKALVLAIIIMTFALISGGAMGAKVLKVGTDPAFPPFESTNDKGEIIGFDMDIIKAVAAAVGYDVQFTAVAWDGIIPGLIAGNYDVIASGMTITDERKQSVNFSDSYFEASQVIITMKKAKVLNKLSDLEGKKVSVQIGTTGDIVVSEEVKNVTVKRFDLVPLALQELFNGNVDAMVIDEAVAQAYAKQFTNIQFGAPCTNEDYGFAVTKKNAQLLADLNSGLKKIKADGTYDKIFAKWFVK